MACKHGYKVTLSENDRQFLKQKGITPWDGCGICNAPKKFLPPPRLRTEKEKEEDEDDGA